MTTDPLPWRPAAYCETARSPFSSTLQPIGSFKPVATVVPVVLPYVNIVTVPAPKSATKASPSLSLHSPYGSTNPVADPTSFPDAKS